MLVPVLVTLIVFLGAIVIYMYIIAPKLNPSLKAEQLISEDKIGEAIVEYRKNLEKFPHDVTTNYKVAQLYLRLERLDQAVMHLEKIIEVNVYNAEVQKIDVLKQLAKLYFQRDDKPKVFEVYYSLLKDYPNDQEGLFHVGFIALGQEMFDLAYKNLDKYTKLNPGRFDVLFGAAISALQSQRLTEALDLIKKALAIKPDSDIANIAMAFALYKKRDYKRAVNYAKVVADSSSDDNAIFICKRLMSFMFIDIKKYSLASKLFEEVKEIAVNRNWEDELRIIYYDLGFAYLIEEKTELAYEMWNQLYQLDRGYLNIQDLITRLRKEMDLREMNKVDDSESVLTEVDAWKTGSFPDDFVWKICGLKSSEAYDLEKIISSMKSAAPVSGGGKTQGQSQSKSRETGEEAEDYIIQIHKLDVENFRSTAYRITEKLDLSIDEILNTYKENDGVDFLAHEKSSKAKVLVWFRRWEGANLGEIPLRNFAQEINDARLEHGYFITTANLSSAGEGALENLGKVTVVGPDEVNRLSVGVL